MQNAYQDYFINRSIYYASRSIVKQGRAVYNIKNMENMSSIAFTQQHRIFKRLDSVTNYYNLTDEQRNAYDEDLKIYRDFQNCMASSERRGEIKGFEKGMEKGMEKGQAQIIRQLVENGMSLQTIADNLQMSLSDIRRIIGEI